MTIRTPSPEDADASLVVGRATMIHPSVLRTVSGSELADSVDRLVADWCDIRAGAEALGDALFDEIGTISDEPPELRPSLVAVRRSIHAMDRPPEHVWTPVVRRSVPDDLELRIDGWALRLVEIEKETATLDRRHEEDLDRRWRALLRGCDDDWFRHALGAASPALSGVLERWRSAPNRFPRRRSLAALTRYLARAATKSSPFSSFNCMVGGGWSDSIAATVVDLDTARSVPEVDPLAWELVVGAAGPLGTADVEIPLLVNPSAEEADGRHRFLGPPWDERWSVLPASVAIDAALEAVRKHGGGGLTAVATAISGTTDVPVERATTFVRELLRLQLVQAALPSPPRVGDGGASEAFLAAPPDGLGQSLRGIEQRLGSTSTAVEAVAGRSAISAGLAELARTVGLTSETVPPRSPALHDTLVADHGSLVLRRQDWSAALEDLDEVLAWLPLHDPLLGFRIAISELAERMCGREGRIGLLRLHQEIETVLGTEDQHGDLRPFFQPDHVARAELLQDSGVLRHRLLADLRRASFAELQPMIESHLSGRGGVLSTLRRQRARAPEFVGTPPSLTAYVQPVTERGGVRLVLSTVHGGFGRGRSRWTYLAGAAPPDITTVGLAEEVVEVDGHWGSALNLRSPSTVRAIEYPGAPPSRNAPDTVRLKDLTVLRDPVTGLLRLMERDAPLRVAHGGMMSESFVPSLARLLIGGFGTSYLEHAAQPVMVAPRPTASGEPGHHSRVDVGAVTLARAQWAFPAKAVPRRGPAEGAARHLRRLGEWARDHRIPPKVFVRAGSESTYAAMDKQRKPTYVDLRLVALVDLLERVLGSLEPEQWLVVEEAYPEPDTLDEVRGGVGALEIVIERALEGVTEAADPVTRSKSL